MPEANTLQPAEAVPSLTVAVSDIVPNEGQIPGVPKTPRSISGKKFGLLKKSILDDPEMLPLRELLLFRHRGQNVVIGGNMRFRAMKELGYKKAVVKFLPPDTPPSKLRAIAIKDNGGFGEWDFDCLANEWDAASLEQWGVDVWQDAGDYHGDAQSSKGQDAEDDGEDFLYFADPPADRIYDSDNEFDIPSLRLDRQPSGGLLLPFAAWGAESRQKKGISTYHFYVDDYHFARIWADPASVLQGGCSELVEPNLSLFDTTPVAYGLQQVYMKRWIARYWQECGAKVYADLNVARKFHKYNRMGIPRGYNAFATRGYADRLEYLNMEIQTAREISGLDKPNMLVYGGGEKVHELCLRQGVIYVEQFIANRVKRKGGSRG